MAVTNKELISFLKNIPAAAPTGAVKYMKEVVETLLQMVRSNKYELEGVGNENVGDFLKHENFLPLVNSLYGGHPSPIVAQALIAYALEEKQIDFDRILGLLPFVEGVPFEEFVSAAIVDHSTSHSRRKGKPVKYSSAFFDSMANLGYDKEKAKSVLVSLVNAGAIESDNAFVNALIKGVAPSDYLFVVKDMNEKTRELLDSFFSDGDKTDFLSVARKISFAAAKPEKLYSELNALFAPLSYEEADQILSDEKLRAKILKASALPKLVFACVITKTFQEWNQVGGGICLEILPEALASKEDFKDFKKLPTGVRLASYLAEESSEQALKMLRYWPRSSYDYDRGSLAGSILSAVREKKDQDFSSLRGLVASLLKEELTASAEHEILRMVNRLANSHPSFKPLLPSFAKDAFKKYPEKSKDLLFDEDFMNTLRDQEGGEVPEILAAHDAIKDFKSFLAATASGELDASLFEAYLQRRRIWANYRFLKNETVADVLSRSPSEDDNSEIIFVVDAVNRSPKKDEFATILLSKFHLDSLSEYGLSAASGAKKNALLTRVLKEDDVDDIIKAFAQTEQEVIDLLSAEEKDLILEKYKSFMNEEDKEDPFKRFYGGLDRLHVLLTKTPFLKETIINHALSGGWLFDLFQSEDQTIDQALADAIKEAGEDRVIKMSKNILKPVASKKSESSFRRASSSRVVALKFLSSNLQNDELMSLARSFLESYIDKDEGSARYYFQQTSLPPQRLGISLSFRLLTFAYDAGAFLKEMESVFSREEMKRFIAGHAKTLAFFEGNLNKIFSGRTLDEIKRTLSWIGDLGISKKAVVTFFNDEFADDVVLIMTSDETAESDRLFCKDILLEKNHPAASVVSAAYLMNRPNGGHRGRGLEKALWALEYYAPDKKEELLPVLFSEGLRHAFNFNAPLEYSAWFFSIGLSREIIKEKISEYLPEYADYLFRELQTVESGDLTGPSSFALKFSSADLSSVAGLFAQDSEYKKWKKKKEKAAKIAAEEEAAAEERRTTGAVKKDKDSGEVEAARALVAAGSIEGIRPSILSKMTFEMLSAKDEKSVSLLLKALNASGDSKLARNALKIFVDPEISYDLCGKNRAPDFVALYDFSSAILAHGNKKELESYFGGEVRTVLDGFEPDSFHSLLESQEFKTFADHVTRIKEGKESLSSYLTKNLLPLMFFEKDLSESAFNSALSSISALGLISLKAFDDCFEKMIARMESLHGVSPGRILAMILASKFSENNLQKEHFQKLLKSELRVKNVEWEKIAALSWVDMYKYEEEFDKEDINLLSGEGKKTFTKELIANMFGSEFSSYFGPRQLSALFDAAGDLGLDIPTIESIMFESMKQNDDDDAVSIIESQEGLKIICSQNLQSVILLVLQRYHVSEKSFAEDMDQATVEKISSLIPSLSDEVFIDSVESAFTKDNLTFAHLLANYPGMESRAHLFEKGAYDQAFSPQMNALCVKKLNEMKTLDIKKLSSSLGIQGKAINAALSEALSVGSTGNLSAITALFESSEILSDEIIALFPSESERMEIVSKKILWPLVEIIQDDMLKENLLYVLTFIHKGTVTGADLWASQRTKKFVLDSFKVQKSMTGILSDTAAMIKKHMTPIISDLRNGDLKLGVLSRSLKTMHDTISKRSEDYAAEKVLFDVHPAKAALDGLKIDGPDIDDSNKDREYVLVFPKDNHETIEWGVLLNNCLQTDIYTDGIVDGEFLILALADRETKEPLVAMQFILKHGQREKAEKFTMRQFMKFDDKPADQRLRGMVTRLISAKLEGVSFDQELARKELSETMNDLALEQVEDAA